MRMWIERRLPVQRHGEGDRRQIRALGVVALLAMVLAGCGATEFATNAVPTAEALATTAATNIPPGAQATVASAATAVASAAPGLRATGAAAATNAAPTVNAAASAVAPTAVAVATQAAGGTEGPEATVTGQVTQVDANARTFTVRAADGEEYRFTATTSSRVDFAQLAANLASNQQVTVTYRNTTSPFEVIIVR